MSSTWKAVQAKSLPELAKVLNEEYNCNDFTMSGTWQKVEVPNPTGLGVGTSFVYEALLVKNVQMAAKEFPEGESIGRMS